jgi:hypothetical protein
MRFALVMVTLVGVAAIAGVPSRAYADEPITVAEALNARHAESWPCVGLMMDAGIPDGAIGSLVVRPWQWFRVYGGGGSNSVSNGWRGGLSLLPFGAGPSVSVEYGHYNDGDANGVVRRLVGGQFGGSPLLSQVGYDYANAHAGLDFGGKNVIFFVHGGVSMVWAQIHNANSALQSSTGSTTVVQLGEDPKVKAVGSSLKVGLIFFLL